MPKIRPLTPSEAKHSLLNRLTRTVDRARQIATKLGARPFRVFLVWTTWTGRETGVGIEKETCRIEILPTPLVVSLDSVTFSIFHAGTVKEGSVRLEEVSNSFTYDLLTGHVVDGEHVDQIPLNMDFFYEIISDGRGDPEPVRQKYRILAQPFRRAEKVDFTVMLERRGQDNERDGSSPIDRGDTG